MGKIQQLGTPAEIYERPANVFVADFIGSANFIEAEMLGVRDGLARLRLTDGTEIGAKAEPGQPTGRIAAAVRPERIAFVEGPGVNRLGARITHRAYLGASHEYEVAGDAFRLRIQTSQIVTSLEVFIHVPPEAIMIFPHGPQVP